MSFPSGVVWHFSFLDEATDDSFRGILVCIEGEEEVGVFCPVGVCYCCLEGSGAGEEGGGVDPFLLVNGKGELVAFGVSFRGGDGIS